MKNLSRWSCPNISTVVVLFMLLFLLPGLNLGLFHSVNPVQTVWGQEMSRRPARETDTLSKDAAPASGLGTSVERKVFTGIAKPAPGEKRMIPGSVEPPKRPIPGTAVHPVHSSAWLRSAPCIILGPTVSQPVHRLHGPGCIDCLYAIQDDAGRDSGQTGVVLDKTPTLAPKNEKIEGAKQDEKEFLEELESGVIEGVTGLTTEDLASEMPVMEWEMDDTLGPYPRPAGSCPVAADPANPREPNLFFPPIGPPRTLRYGLVADPSIPNTPYAPGSAAAKVYSNGRPVTMTERAQGAEGRASSVRLFKLAHHTNVATSLPQYCDGLEHCPVCMRAYLCGCAEENCRFCQPEMRIGPPPVCEGCGEKRPCIHGSLCNGQLGHAPYREGGNTSGGIACPICKKAVESVPCGLCEKCYNGQTCELYQPCGKCPSCLVFEKCDLYKAHRDCVLPNRTNSCNRCDLTINGEPCGSCDWCRENSDLNHELCGHQEVGLLQTKTVYNPYNECPIFSAPPRILTDRFNNRSSKFPIYYNPAPYYKSTSNPATWGAYQRPFTFRWTCELCKNDPCTCTAPGHSGQVAYAYACKFCDRTPCACTAEICNSNAPLNPKSVRSQLDELVESSKPRPSGSLTTGTSSGSNSTTTGSSSTGQSQTGPSQGTRTNDRDNVWQTPPPPLPGSNNGTLSPPRTDNTELPIPGRASDSDQSTSGSRQPLSTPTGTPSSRPDSTSGSTTGPNVQKPGDTTTETSANRDPFSMQTAPDSSPVSDSNRSGLNLSDISPPTMDFGGAGSGAADYAPPSMSLDLSPPSSTSASGVPDNLNLSTLPLPGLSLPALPGENLGNSGRTSGVTGTRERSERSNPAPTDVFSDTFSPNQSSTPLGSGGRSLEGPQNRGNQKNPGNQANPINPKNQSVPAVPGIPGTRKGQPNSSSVGSVSFLRSNLQR
ncbi:MAG: hypothetical protein ACRC10_10885 [Thermoguttaceae bacterium]